MDSNERHEHTSLTSYPDAVEFMSKKVNSVFKTVGPEQLKIFSDFGQRNISNKEFNMQAASMKEAINTGRGFTLPVVSENIEFQKAFAQAALATMTYQLQRWTSEEKKKNIPEILIRLDTHDQCSTEYEQACADLNNAMSSGHREALYQLVMKGPVYDGDIVSKSARDDLFSWSLASRAHYKGEQGFSVANYRGGEVLKAVKRISTKTITDEKVIEFKEKFPDDYAMVLDIIHITSAELRAKRIIQNATGKEKDECGDIYSSIHRLCYI